MKLILKAKPLEMVCSVTDAMRAAGLKPGRYTLGDLDIIVENNVAVLPDRSCYAGSVATMDLCVRNMISLGGLTLSDAIKTATIYPTRVIGVDERKGSLVPGKDADIVILDEDIEIYTTIVAGEIQYSR
jgi:N-acetylglucosamine-6-phosphate deacetylase